MTQELGLERGSLVVELASNDGYLLQYFRQLAIGVLGVEPAANVAAVARDERRADRGRVLRRGDGAAARRRRAGGRT